MNKMDKQENMQSTIQGKNTTQRVDPQAKSSPPKDGDGGQTLTMTTESNTPPSVTVAVVAHKAGRVIHECLKSISNQDYPPNLLRILVVDDSNDPQTIHACKEYGAQYLYAPETDTPGKARNVALRHAKSDVIAFLDTDCVAPPNWLKTIVSDLREHREVVGVVGCYTGGKNWVQKVFNQESVTKTKEVKAPVGILEGNCAFWVKAIEGKSFGVYKYSEGNVLSTQIAADGKKILLDYDLKVIHNGFTYTPRKFFHMGRAQMHNNRDYFGGSLRAEVFSVCVVASLAMLLASPIYSWLLALPSLGVTAVFVRFAKTYQKQIPSKWIIQSYLYFILIRWFFWVGYFTEYVTYMLRGVLGRL